MRAQQTVECSIIILTFKQRFVSGNIVAEERKIMPRQTGEERGDPVGKHPGFWFVLVKKLSRSEKSGQLSR
jgi:hypothetical protein